MAKLRVMLTGGGTGGHIYPALAVAEVLTDDADLEALIYVGARGHMEEGLAKERHLDFVGLGGSGMPRKLSWKLFAWPFKTFAAVMSARKVLDDFNPTIVLGTGGYASAPPLFAALVKGVPFAIHEPDAHPGLVNRIFAKYARVVSLGMDAAQTMLKSSNNVVRVNGNPVRKTLTQLPARDAACAILGLRPELKTVLVTGGSQGARAINDVVIASLKELLEVQPLIQVIHQVGDKNLRDCREQIDPLILENPRYQLRGYIDDMALAYSVCDLMICRAGAMTIAELGVTGTPAIFIPYPFAAQDHQTFNARFVETTGGALVIPQSELTPERLKSEVVPLLTDDARLKKMKECIQKLGRPRAALDLVIQLKNISASQ